MDTKIYYNRPISKHSNITRFCIFYNKNTQKIIKKLRNVNLFRFTKLLSCK